METLSADEARRAALVAQGLTGVAPSRLARSGLPARAGAVRRTLDRLGAVQLDTISVLARSHELVMHARLGPLGASEALGRDAIEHAYWRHEPGDAAVFEFWSHAACLIPARQWPAYAFRRRANRARGQRWHPLDHASVRTVLARLRAEGPLTSTELGGARRGGDWWDWSETKVAVEWLLDVGEVVVAERRGWRRVYDLPERALPPTVLDADPDDATCVRLLVSDAGHQLGVATEADLAEQYRLRREQVRAALPDTELVPVLVEGWRDPAWARPDLVDLLGDGGRSRTTLLSPFDSLVWDRRRTARMFGMDHRLEAYTPAPKRVHGYFAMPVLHRGRLVARVDPKRVGATLHARRVTFEATTADAVRGVARALHEAGAWVGCAQVVVDDVVPARLGAPLRQALATA